MLKLSLRKREQIEITTPQGVVTLMLFGDGHVGIDAPKAWGIRRFPLPEPVVN